MAVWIARFLARAAQVEKATNTALRINRLRRDKEVCQFQQVQQQLANLAAQTIANTKFEIDVRNFERTMHRYQREVNYTLAEVLVKQST